jgi:transcriptional regulator with XRE-family HTH domain
LPTVPSSTTSPETPGGDFGSRLRSSRRAQGLSLQALASRAEVSASFISQVETGKSQPSVATLFALATSLGVPIVDLFGDRDRDPQDSDRYPIQGAHARPWTSEYGNRVSLVHPAHRAKLAPSDGVAWERLAATPDRGVNFKQIVYAPGTASAPGGELVSHAGHEYGYVMSGEVEVVVGDFVATLGPGESIDFPSTVPHLLRNTGIVDFVGIWIDHYPFH